MRSLTPITAVACAALLLSGCLTKAPPAPAELRAAALADTALPETWKAGGAPGGEAQGEPGTAQGASFDNWLAAFNDAQLNALVNEALARNPDLRVAATRVEQAAQYVEQAKAQLRPTIGLYGTGGLNAGGGEVGARRAGGLGVIRIAAAARSTEHGNPLKLSHASFWPIGH